MAHNVKILCAALVLVGAVSSTNVFAQAAQTTGNGVPISGFPSADERLVLVLVNRARADPQTELVGCGASCGEAACYKPTAPAVWAYELNRSARFHSMNMEHVGFAHDSQCQLVSDISQRFPPNGTCMGDAACACVGGTATGTTSWVTRIGMFGGSPGGENIALGFGSPRSVFYAWLYETDSDPTCGFRYTNGHRKNILENGPALGTGGDQGSWTQDFGYGSTSTMDKLVAGANEDNDFYANWYDPQGAGPTSARVNIDGTCSALTLERGTQQNGTWKGTVAGNGCRHYTFELVDSAGTLHVLPETGSYATGCATDYDATAFAHCGQPPIVDAGTPPSTDAGSGGSTQDAGNGGGSSGNDAGVDSGSSGGSSPDAGPSDGNGNGGGGTPSTGSPSDNGNGNANVPISTGDPNAPIEGTIGCSAVGAPIEVLALVVVVAFAALTRRRRRR